jgi:hypothetical protein
MKKSTVPALYGQASAILKYAKQNYEQLFKYIEMQAKGLSLAEAFLRINPDYSGLSVVDETFARAGADDWNRAFGKN